MEPDAVVAPVAMVQLQSRYSQEKVPLTDEAGLTKNSHLLKLFMPEQSLKEEKMPPKAAYAPTRSIHSAPISGKKAAVALPHEDHE